MGVFKGALSIHPGTTNQERRPRNYEGRLTSRGFTYIELLITLAILAVLFVPVMELFSSSLYASSTSQALITATSLARLEMERTKNLNVTKEQLKETGDSLYPPLDEGPIEMNEMKWRIKREVMEETDPLEVRVHVYAVKEAKTTGKKADVLSDTDSEFQEEKPVVTLVTLVENMFWEKIQPIE